MKKIAIYGSGGMGREAKWLIDDINRHQPEWEFIGYFDDQAGEKHNAVKDFILGGLTELNNWQEDLHIVIAIGNPLVKRKIAESINNSNVHFCTLIHPDVYCESGRVQIGEGSIICKGNILTVDVIIGRHVLLNIGTIVCHDSIIGDFSSLMPCVNISGNVTIGQGVYVGTGAKIIHQIEIGDETIVGAGAVVVKNLPPRCTAVGVPSRPISYKNK